MKKVLLLYPNSPDNTYWGFKHALSFIGKKAAFPPLGLITIAALFPSEWEIRLIDMNIEELKEKHLKWADYIVISGMCIHKHSAKDILTRCKNFRVKIIAGGPLFQFSPNPEEEFPEIDHFILGEAETTLEPFLSDLKKGVTKRLYHAQTWIDLKKSPIPRFDLIKMEKYSSMCLQYSRGCPFNCEYCNIKALSPGVRTKNSDQLIAELDNLYRAGWRGSVFIVDDNFIGQPRKLTDEVLPAIIRWQEKRKCPFTFYTEASINLAANNELIRLMVEAGFDTVFIGIESIHKASLVECHKTQNQKVNLLEAVKSIQRAGLEVQAGFILGFDNDPPTIFKELEEFIQESGICTAMIGLLQAVPQTRLYERLEREGRILLESSGNNTDTALNFIPRMDPSILVEGYKDLVKKVYSPEGYYARVKILLGRYTQSLSQKKPATFNRIKAAFKAVALLGIREKKERRFFWNLLFWTIKNKPGLFPLAITLSIFGYHLRKTFGDDWK